LAGVCIQLLAERIHEADRRVTATGGNEEILRLRGPATRVIDGRRRTVIPGLNDSHMHPIRGGLNYNLELRWDGVPSLADALRMLKDQAARTPAPQWVRVIGGWTEFQFAERRMPTVDEIDAVAPDTPVFVMHLYDRALLNGAALRALGYDKNVPDFPAGEVQRDHHGNPTGLLIARPNANILYSTLAKGPKLSRELHATYNETIERALNVYEEVNREIPFDGLHWFFDHCETITDRNIERVKALGGGIAVQNRMAFQGEYFVERYGARQAKRTPPIRRMLEIGVPVGAGTDATRVSSYNPYLSLYWLITGKTIGGLELYPEENRLDRAEALKLYTMGSSWFSTEDGKKGALAPGQLADLAVLSADYFSIPGEEIKQLESVLTIVGGKIVYATEEFSKLAPPALPVSPSWSPVKQYGGFAKGELQGVGASHSASCSHIENSAAGRAKSHLKVLGDLGLWGLGCDCFAF
jgi:predicted amidohydrolase YtcJ